MVFVGTVEPGSETMGGRSDWIRLIEGHPLLSPVPAVAGINPFTRRPNVYTANPDTAQILKEAKQIGSIHWAMDGSCRLVVWSHPGCEEQVKEVAEDVAARLGWHLVIGGAA
jgi:hypothetical protein